MNNHNNSADVKTGVIYLIPTLISAVLPFISLPILTRFLSIEDFGLLALSMVYSTLINGIVNFGTSLIFERNFFEYSKNQKKLSQLFFSTLLFISINFILLLSLTFFIQENVSIVFTGSPGYGKLFLLAFISQFIFLNLTKNHFTYFRNNHRPKVFAYYAILNSFMNFIFTIVFVAYLKLGIYGILFSQILCGSILFLLMSLAVSRDLKFSLSKDLLFGVLKLSYPLTPRLLVGVLNNQFSLYMVGMLANIGLAGIYDLAQKFSNFIFSVMTALENVFNPKVYEMLFENEDPSNEIGRYLTPFFFYSVLMAIMIAYSAEEFIFFFLPLDFHGAIEIIYILSIYATTLFFGKIFSILYLFKKKTFWLSLFSILSLFLNILINIPLIRQYGAIGAAYGTLLSSVIVLSLSYRVVLRYFYLHWEMKKIFFIIILMIISFASMIFIKQISNNHIFLISLKAISLSIFIYVGLRLRLVDYDLIKGLRNHFIKI